MVQNYVRFTLPKIGNVGTATVGIYKTTEEAYADRNNIIEQRVIANFKEIWGDSLIVSSGVCPFN